MEDEIVNDAPDGAEVVDVEEVPDTSSLEAELDQVLKADKLAAVADTDEETPVVPGAPSAPAPGTPEARSAERIAKAKAAEQARAERRRESSTLAEAERLVKLATERTAQMEAQYAQRLAQAEALENEKRTALEKFRADVKAGGLEALQAHGLNYEELVAAQLDLQDPQAIAKSAAAEVAELKRLLREKDENEAKQRKEAEEAQFAHRIAQAEHQDRLALVNFAENAPDVPPQVARLARSARENRAAAKLLIETADEIKEAFMEELGRRPRMSEVVQGLDQYLDFLRDGGQPGSASQATAPQSSQVARHQRTLGSPDAAVRNATERRSLSQDEQEAAELRALNEAFAKDRGF
jgi:hypothetical protein